MNPTTRRAFRTLAWVIFLFGAPTLLAYAWGYRAPSLGPRESLVPQGPSVGALVIRTTPRGARALLDGRVVDERTPAGISGIPHGMHLVRIEKPGYRTYEKRVEVRGGQVTDLLHVRLIPDVLEEEIVRQGVSGVWVSPDERWVVLREGSTLDILPRRALPALSPESSIRDIGGFEALLPRHRPGELVFFWGPNGNAVAVGLHRVDDVESPASLPDSLALIDLTNGRLRAMPPRTALVGWNLNGPERVLLLNGEGVLLGLSAQATKPEEIATGILAAAIHPRGVLVQRATAESGEAPFGLLRNGGEFQPFPPAFPEPASAFQVSPEGTIAGLSKDRTLFLRSTEDQTWRAVAEGVRHFAWSPDGNKLLYQESVFDVSVVNVSEDRSVLQKLKPEFLLRLSLPLRNLQWFSDSQQLLYFDQDILRLLDIDPRGGHRTEDLASVDRGDALATVLEDGAIMLVTARREPSTQPTVSGRTSDVLLRLFLRTADDR
ncbi:MAG: PEGA domain-containing protein [bacterium]|nr:PEGA domain-containing protein [bacterium]